MVTQERAKRVLDGRADELMSKAKASGVEVYGMGIGERGSDFAIVVLVGDVKRASGAPQQMEGVRVVYEQGGLSYAL